MPKKSSPVRRQVAKPEVRSVLSAEHKARYNALVGEVNLADVRLIEVSGRVRPEAIPDGDVELALQVPNPEYRGVYHPDDGVIYCGVRLKATLGPGEPREAVVEVFAEYALIYQLPKGAECPEEISAVFAARNGVFNAWPFFREQVHTLVAKMGLPPLVLPLFRLPPVPPGIK